MFSGILGGNYTLVPVERREPVPGARAPRAYPVATHVDTKSLIKNRHKYANIQILYVMLRK